MKKALIVQGGWQGHEPKQVADILAKALVDNGFAVEMADTLDALLDVNELKKLDLLVPEWTMGSITREQLTPMLEAVKSGVGIAGVHGGMGDAFRNETEFQYMVGGQWVAHPGGDGVKYMVHITKPCDPIVAGLCDFQVSSEQYYMHVDLVNEVLATTLFGDTAMPVTWKKTY
ncbi:MAG: ThuA domain-containing protein, partial [Anaerolineae bacterium]